MSDLDLQTWPPGLALDLALGLRDRGEILSDYGIGPDQWAALENNLHFRREISKLSKELNENGLTFKTKARMLAESYLLEVDDIVMDPKVAVGLRLEAIQSMVKWADLEPKKAGAGEGGGGPTFNLQINVG